MAREVSARTSLAAANADLRAVQQVLAVSSILAKFAVRDRTRAVLKALEAGLCMGDPNRP